MSPFFFFNDTATTEIYPLSLHDALPILAGNFAMRLAVIVHTPQMVAVRHRGESSVEREDLKSVSGKVEVTNDQIGRASCRERVEISVGAVSLKKKNVRPSRWRRGEVPPR